MKSLEKTIKILRNYDNNAELKELRIELEKDLLEKISLKGSNRSKISAIKKVCTNTIRPILEKYTICDNKIVFTDSYQLYAINEIDMPIQKATYDDRYPNISNLMPKIDYADTDIIDLDTKNIVMEYKLKKETIDIGLKDTHIKTELLYDAYRILGSDLKYKSMENEQGIYIVNKDNEKAVILGVRVQ